MNNKKNLKGFTLVELVIVGTIMVMIMGMVLNLIQPMNRFYQRTQNLADANDIGGIVMDTVDNSVRYATDMVILEDYAGVPLMKDGCLIDASGGQSFKYKFTNVIILDEAMPRGKVLDGYDPDDTPAHRKVARGSILQAPVLTTGDGIDFSKLRYVGGEEIYSDYRARFQAGLNIVDERNKCLSIDMKLWKPEYKNGQYVFEKEIYNQQRDIELVNINLNNSNFKVEYYSDRAGSNATPINYSKFPKSSPTSTANANQQELFTSGLHTFIFFTNSVVDNDSSEVMVGLKRNGIDGYLVGPYTYTKNSPIPASDILAFEQAARNAEWDETVGGINYHYKRSTIKSSLGENITAYESGTKKATQSFDFIAEYQPEATLPPLGSYTFLDHAGNVISSGSITRLAVSDTAGDVPMPSAENWIATSAPGGPVEMMPKRDYKERFVEGGVNFDPAQKYSGNHTWETVYEPVPKSSFEFFDADGTTSLGTFEFKTQYSYPDETNPTESRYIDGVRGTAIAGDAAVSALTVTVPSGENFDKWEVFEVVGGSRGASVGYLDNNFMPVEGTNYEVVATTVAAPTGGMSLEGVSINPNPWWYDTFDIRMSNQESVPIKAATFVVTFSEPVSTDYNTSQYMDFCGWSEGHVTLDPSDHTKVTLTIEGQSYGAPIQPGGTVTLSLKFKPETSGSTGLNVASVECTAFR